MQKWEYKVVGVASFRERIEDRFAMLRASLNYSRQYPKNPRSLSTFSCLTNTVMRRRKPLPFLLASFLYILLPNPRVPQRGVLHHR